MPPYPFATLNALTVLNAKKTGHLALTCLLLGFLFFLSACSAPSGPSKDSSSPIKPGYHPLVTGDQQGLLTPSFEDYNAISDLKAYYAQWKNGNHYDAQAKRLASPGYVQQFELPEPFALPWETQGSTQGAVVVMVPNGTPDELPGDYCVSTDEAMGYGLIIAALMDDRVLFDQLLRVCLYYANYNQDRYEKTGNGWEPHLTTWAIPAKKGRDWFETEEFKQLSTESQAQWRENGVRYAPAYKEGTAIKESVILGEDHAVQNSGGSATDGELDIAYALYLAWWQWESGSQVGADSEPDHYRTLARSRFKAFFDQVVVPYGQVPNSEQASKNQQAFFLPTGDYSVNYDDGQAYTTGSLTRPCDWFTAQIRTYYIDSQDKRALDLIESLYTLAPAVAHPQTGLVPDFSYWLQETKGQYALAPAPDEIANEWMSAYFYMNSARFPFRMAMDTYHYEDQRGLAASQKILDTFLAKYSFASLDDHATYPPAIHALDGTPNDQGLWNNPVLNAALYATASISQDPKYTDFVNLGWKSMASSFDSRYNDYDQNGLGLEPGHSGYFSDTWRLLALLIMSGNWPNPL